MVAPLLVCLGCGTYTRARDPHGRPWCPLCQRERGALDRLREIRNAMEQRALGFSAYEQADMVSTFDAGEGRPLDHPLKRGLLP
jgi:hypothetical protein